MANPFDQFDAPANPFDQFDAVAPQSPLMGEFKDLPKGVVQGLVDPFAGGAQLLTGGNNQAINDYIQQREQGIPTSPAFNVGRGLGNAAAGLPLAALVPGAAAEGLGARLASGAVSGALTGALQPAQPGDNFLQQKAEQAGAGALGGAGGALGTGALARTISGATNPALKTVGGTPTPGMIIGGRVNEAEQKLMSFPGVGDMIANRRRDMVMSMNETAINRALGHIGEQLEGPVGREGIAEMHQKISDAYNQLLPQLTWRSDPTFVSDMNGIRTNTVNRLPQSMQQQFNGIVNTAFNPPLRMQNNAMSGRDFKDVDSILGQEAANYSSSPNPDQRTLGRSLRDVQASLRSALSRSNPNYSDRLDNINAAFADSVRVEGAAASQGAKEGIFTPAQLSASVRKQDPSIRKGAFARGEAKMQDLSDAAQKVAGNTVPDSGTAGRALIGMAMAAMTGEHVPYARYVTWPVIGTNLAGMGLYSKPANYLMSQALANRPAIAGPLSDIVRRTAPFASAGGGGILGRSIQ